MAGLSSEVVFRKDLEALESSDLVVAFLDEPSLGVGAEVALALARGLPTIGMRSGRAHRSRFVEGLLEDAPRACILTYSDLEDLAPRIVAFLSGLGSKRSASQEPAIAG